MLYAHKVQSSIITNIHKPTITEPTPPIASVPKSVVVPLPAATRYQTSLVNPASTSGDDKNSTVAATLLALPRYPPVPPPQIVVVIALNHNELKNENPERIDLSQCFDHKSQPTTMMN
ncbi:hypothetical protein RJT34_23860 [Clitoria ternatea]|uniref:Uncharacterized protein n=1 Tax=Clitoria ternatea TaxID=43366 RepID=A0AAN9FLT1_CLITE